VHASIHSALIKMAYGRRTSKEDHQLSVKCRFEDDFISGVVRRVVGETFMPASGCMVYMKSVDAVKSTDLAIAPQY